MQFSEIDKVILEKVFYVHAYQSRRNQAISINYDRDPVVNKIKNGRKYV